MTLKERREAAGLTGPELASLAHTTKQQISKLEAGDRELTKSWAVRLARPLGTTWIDLLKSPQSEKDRARAEELLAELGESPTSADGPPPSQPMNDRNKLAMLTVWDDLDPGDQGTVYAFAKRLRDAARAVSPPTPPKGKLKNNPA